MLLRDRDGGEVAGAHDAGLRTELGDAQLGVWSVPAGGEMLQERPPGRPAEHLPGRGHAAAEHEQAGV